MQRTTVVSLKSLLLSVIFKNPKSELQLGTQEILILGMLMQLIYKLIPLLQLTPPKEFHLNHAPHLKYLMTSNNHQKHQTQHQTQKAQPLQAPCTEPKGKLNHTNIGQHQYCRRLIQNQVEYNMRKQISIMTRRITQVTSKRGIIRSIIECTRIRK